MKEQTENALRQALSMDTGITQSEILNVIDMINGLKPHLADLVHVVRYEEVQKTLNTTRDTVYKYVQAGILQPVYGCGAYAFGVTRASLQRFISGDQDGRDDTPPQEGSGRLNPLTRTLITSILQMDGDIPDETISDVLHYLNRTNDPAHDPSQVILYADAERMLGIQYQAIQNLVRHGCLERAYSPRRKLAVGVTVGSYRRLTETPSPIHDSPTAKKVRTKSAPVRE